MEEALTRIAEGDTLSALERKLGINRKSLQARARLLGLQIPRSGGQEQYLIDHQAFRTIRTAEQAYVLGLLAADGNVHHPKDGRAPIISLRVQAQDEWLVRITCRVLGTEEGRIRHWVTELNGRKHDVVGVAVSSVKIAADLARNGVVPRKSLALAFPQHLPIRLQRHWLRGLFDGDGITAYVSNGEPRVNLGYCGPKELMATLSDLLFERCDLSHRSAISRNGYSHTTWRVQWRGREDVHRIAEYLYGDGGMAMTLPRKRDLLLQALGCPNHGDARRCTLRRFVQLSFAFLESATMTTTPTPTYSSTATLDAFANPLRRAADRGND